MSADLDRGDREGAGARLWPVPVLLGLTVFGYWASIRWTTGMTVGYLAGVTLGLFVLLLVWLFAFSRLSRRGKVVGLLAILAVPAVLAGLFRVRGYTGETVPVFELRWGRPEVRVPGASTKIVLTPSPHDVLQFPGPGRRPRFPAVDLARDWTDRPPVERWRQPLGEAFSSFAVVGEHAFTQTQLDEDECVLCIHWPSGETRWVQREPAHFVSSVGGNGPRATPTIYEGRVYSLGGTGILSCLDATDGSRVWAHDLVADFHGRSPQWGYAGSPLVTDKLVVVGAGGKDGWSLLAFDRVSGDLLWHGGDHPAAYSSPMIAEIGGARVIVIADDDGLTIYQPETGVELGHTPLGKGENVAQPVLLDGDHLFYSKGYGTGSQLWELARGESGTFAFTSVWRSRRVMKTKFTQPVLYEGLLYGVSAGMAFECTDPRTGKRVWWERGAFGHGQTIGTGGLLLTMTEQGELVLIEANPERYVELARHRVFDGRTWNQPVLIGNTILARNELEAVCLELPLSSPAK